MNRFNSSKRNGLRHGLAIIAVVSLVGCETVKPNWQRHTTGLDHELKAHTGDADLNAPANNQSSVPLVTESRKSQAKIYPGQAIITPESRSSTTPDARFRAKGGDIVLNFVDIPIREAARMILSDQLGKEFTISPEVQGQVSLNNQGGLSSSDLVPTLEVLLSTVNARLTIQNNSYSIVPGAERTLTVSQGNFEIIPLRYIDAAEFAKLLDGYQVSATAIKRGNLLALNGSNSKIKKVKELARSFDVNWLKGMSIGLFPVDNTSAETIRGELVELFGQEIDKSQAQAMRIIAIERSNSIMVIANHTDSVKMIGDWVERLDKAGGASNQAFFIYRVQNGRATDLAKLLESMFGNTGFGNTNQLASDDERSRTAPRSLSNLQPKNNFRVVADESTNSLIVTGSPHYYKAVRDAMKQLDSTPLQVLIEARIMELTLSDDLQYGLEWYLNGSRGNSNTRGGLDLGSPGIGAIQPGFSYVVKRAGEVRAALNGLADDSRLKVLSSPSLMVLNNHTASILVGDEVPIPTRQAVSNISPEAPTVSEIEYRNTGILLTVSPRVNSGGMVTMEISQEVSSVINNTTSQIDAPTIQQRQLNSTVSIRDGQTVVLGGLIREQSSNRETGVPLLKDIPVLGKLFSTTTDVSKRTELIVLITPRVISNGDDTDAITKEYREKMIGLRPIPLSQL
ncbi:MAG: type II secretion system secretin GspD [Arenicella sp.]|nr:type II secretion system secretin GspD [Arenicella sp.]